MTTRATTACSSTVTGNASLGFSITAMAYHGSWNSTDQVAESAVASNLISLYGSQSPNYGGYSQRYSLQGEWHSQGLGLGQPGNGLRFSL